MVFVAHVGLCPENYPDRFGRFCRETLYDQQLHVKTWTDNFQHLAPRLVTAMRTKINSTSQHRNSQHSTAHPIPAQRVCECPIKRDPAIPFWSDRWTVYNGVFTTPPIALHFVLTDLVSSQLSAPWLVAPRRTESHHSAPPSSPWLWPITAHAVQMKLGRLRWSQTRWDETSGVNRPTRAEVKSVNNRSIGLSDSIGPILPDN